MVKIIGASEYYYRISGFKCRTHPRISPHALRRLTGLDSRRWLKVANEIIAGRPFSLDGCLSSSCIWVRYVGVEKGERRD